MAVNDEASDLSPDDMEDLKLWINLARAYAALAAHARADISRHGLTPGEFGALEALLHRGPMLLGEVQRRILVSSGGATYVIDRLEERGLVERRRCDEDRRAWYAALTPRGEALIAEIFPAHARRMLKAMSGLDRAERAAARTLLRKLGRTAQEMPEPGPAEP